MIRRLAYAAAAVAAVVAAIWAGLVAAIIADHATWAATADPNHTPEGEDQ